MSSKPSKKKSRRSASFSSHGVAAADATDDLLDELDLIATLDTVLASTGRERSRKGKCSVSIIENSSDEESKSSSSGSDEESDEDIAVVEMPSKLITPPGTGKKQRRRRESKKCELYIILLLYYF